MCKLPKIMVAVLLYRLSVVMPAIMRRDTCLDLAAQHSHPVTANEVITLYGRHAYEFSSTEFI